MFDLFISETCPYCQKVMAFMNDNNIEYHKFDILNKDNVKKLISLGGIEQVPFLYNEDSGLTMYESDDIIEYLKKFV